MRIVSRWPNAPLPLAERNGLRQARSAVRQTANVLLLMLLLGCHRPETAAVAAKPDDIILVTIDTLRADSVGYAGNAQVKTPFLDRIASEGIVFTNAHG